MIRPISKSDPVAAARAFYALSSHGLPSGPASNPDRSRSHDIADTIRRQIGEPAFRMLGTTLITTDGPSITFDVRSSKTWNRITITLDTDTGTDTYTVKFWRLGRAPGYGITEGEPHVGVYVDMLHDLIEGETGLYTSIRPRRS